MKSVAVFCGSSSGSNGIYTEKARQVGRILAEKGIRLVYGGAKVGLMGAVADGALSAGGEVVGVIPGFLLTKEVGHENLSELILVDTMHERKTIEYELCDGAIALPGGFGTLDELFEMLTWGQLGLHSKPVGLLNINSYFTHLGKVIDTMVNEGFLKGINRDMVLESDEIEDLILKMETYVAPDEAKWILNKR
ncbi:MAG: TIGR00730 family Rossman fold protein [Bacteroidales bacterium]|nr:TIGR00730 family Rossman fold protein [Bacteroidales bacterium]